ncbi:nucleoside hydrolase-like domain-containing protein [Cytophaga sp. FL35]|uniref:nucleoside hydrolase-like domain-containing protein n=1 Tax=Cytophaga sp. FL35 TaxID=1904456 RepID=UPI001653A682|nr:nucleoside hydrolase-like domain-containing protein [Cytophaga sp. FL35]MBC6999915.1 DUF1593 domain-containing protein [Cytophaga sp. FL35]
MNRLIKVSLILWCIQSSNTLLGYQPPENLETTFDVIIDTDLGGDPDDIQSLFRAVHYSDILKIKGIISTPNSDKNHHPWDTIPNVKLIKNWVKRIDVDHLRRKGYTHLMTEEELLLSVKEGSQSKGAPSTLRSSEGSNWIIATARNYTRDQPLWILVWGSMTTTAQALHDAPDIADKIRIYYIGSTNTLHDTESRNFVFNFMEKEFPNLWWIENGVLPKGSHETFRGVYHLGKQEGEWAYTSFINSNIRNHRSDHAGMFKEKNGDIFPTANYPKNSLKEGDSPSLLYLISPVLGNVGQVNDPTQESWGGQFRHFNARKFPNYYVDLDLSPEECQMTIAQWRYDFLNDWKLRWDRYSE